jgi:hypothetical protein
MQPLDLRRQAMLGLLLAVVFVFFVGGFLVGTLLGIAVPIRIGDGAATRRMLTMKRLDRSILLHEEPQGS